MSTKNPDDKIMLTRAAFTAWENVYMSRGWFRRMIMQGVVWFGIPFLTLWGFGVEPANAARAAVFCMMVASVAFVVCAWVGFGAMRALFELLVTSAQFDTDKELARAQAYTDAMNTIRKRYPAAAPPDDA